MTTGRTNKDAAGQKSLFAVQVASAPSGPTAPAGAGFTYRGAAAQLDDAYIDAVITALLGFFSGQGGLGERLHLTGATDEEIAASVPTMFSLGGGFKCAVEGGGTPALRYSAAGEELFTLSSAELAARLRRLFHIPHPKPADEIRQLRRARLEAERQTQRREAQGFVGRILRAGLKGSEHLAASIAGKLFAADCLTPAGDQRVAEEIYQLLLARGWAAHAAMKAAGEIVAHAAGGWERAEERWGARAGTYRCAVPARTQAPPRDLFAAATEAQPAAA